MSELLSSSATNRSRYPRRGKLKADIEKCQRNFLLADFEPDQVRPKRREKIEANHARLEEMRAFPMLEE
jgi:hypothetical protein